MFWNKKKLVIMAPLSGSFVPLEQVPDPVFSERMVGDGAAISPADEGVVKAPCDGKIEVLFPTFHAIGLQTESGVDVLIHIGLDTVEMKGKGFEGFVKEGETVTRGQPLIKFDLNALKEAGKSPLTPVLITNMEKIKGLTVIKENGPYKAGETPLLEVTL